MEDRYIDPYDSGGGGLNGAGDSGGVEKGISDFFNKIAKTHAGPVAQNDFFRAVKSNNVQAVRALLEKGIDPNVYNGNGQTALHIAALNNAAEAAQLLIKHGADPKLGQRDKPEHLPLEDAISFNKPKMVDLLARHGGYTPGAMVDGWSLLHRACQKGKAALVEALLRAGADCNEMTDNGSTPLLIAVKLGHTELAETLLNYAPVAERMNDFFVKTDERKRNAFHLAVGRGQVPVIAVMIGKGADVNSKDAEGKSPLMVAVDSANIPLICLLVESGADLNRNNSPHGTPLAHACKSTEINDEKARAAVIDTLMRLGADADIPTPEGLLPIHLVLSPLRTLEALEALLRYPVDKSGTGGSCIPPLLYAAAHVDSVRRLLVSGADPNGRDAVDARTPLIEAVKRNSLDSVLVLLEAGANPKLCDSHRRSALSYARENGQKYVVEALERALAGKMAGKKIMPPPAQP